MQISIWNVYNDDAEVLANNKLPGLTWPIHQHMVTAYYPMNNQDEENTMVDRSEFDNNATLHNIKYVDVS